MNGFIFFKDRAPVRLVRWDIAEPWHRFPWEERDVKVIKYFSSIWALYVYVEFMPEAYTAGTLSAKQYIRIPQHSVYAYDNISDSWRAVENFDRIEMYDLKPCPFCGSDVTMVYSEQPRIMYGIKCNNDNCVLGAQVKEFEHPHNLVDAWNKRADAK